MFSGDPSRGVADRVARRLRAAAITLLVVGATAALVACGDDSPMAEPDGGGAQDGGSADGGRTRDSGTVGDSDAGSDAGTPPADGCPAMNGIDAGYYSCARVFYVSPEGDDANGGTSPEQAKRTIGAAAVLPLVPGDCVEVADGTYAESVRIDVGGTDGSCTGQVAFRSASRHGAKIVAGGYSAVMVRADWVVVDGFDVDAADGHGIDADGSNHVSAFRNRLHDCGGSGFSSQHGDYYRVEGNVVFGNARTNGYQTSGISLYQLRASDDEPGFHNVIRGNYVYDNGEFELDVSVVTDGNGIIIDDLRNTQGDGPHVEYPAETLIENNVVFGNGARGIHLFFSDHVAVRNNTVFDNNRDERVDGTWNGELVNAFASDNTWANNVAYRGPDSRSNARTVVDGCTEAGDNVGNTWTHNLTFTGTVGASGVLSNCTGSDGPTDAVNLLGVDPELEAPVFDPDSIDLSPSAGSPVIGAGTADHAAERDFTGHERPSPPSIGAYEP